eukprot:GHUV01047542.1.p1 GENE.GHUV01047542.1~~GHUV01047542.1.p1  ORF type:complete len:211 (+),score=89.86 GHUV01047542.1:96-635(+)
MTAELQAAVAALFPNALLYTAYGMTEASSSITFITLHEQQRRQAAAAGVCVGWPAPGIAVRTDPTALEQQQQVIQSSSSCSTFGNQQRPHQMQQQRLADHSTSNSSSSKGPTAGEVCTHGPHLMSGYWAQPDVTNVTITHDGWLRTGDLGFLDQQVQQRLIASFDVTKPLMPSNDFTSC